MAPSDPQRPLLLAVLVLAGTLVALPWATGGRSPTGQAGLVLLLALAGAAGLLCRDSDPPLRLPPLLLVGGILVGLSAVFTIYPDRTVQSLLLLLAYLVACGLAARAALQLSWAERALLDAIWVSGLAVAGLGMLWWVRGNDGGFYANVLIGPFGYPNAMGGFLLLAGFAALATLTPDRCRLERGGALLGCAMSLFGLYLTRSRGVLLAAAAGLLLWALVRRERWWPRRPLWGIAAALVALGGLAFLGWRLSALLPLLWPGDGGTPDTSSQWRLQILRWTWAMVRDHPWAGVGPGAFPVALTHYQQLPYISGENPHNLYLEIAAEYGLAAGILVTGSLVLFLGRAALAARRLPQSDPARGRQAALAGAVMAFALHSAFDLDWSFPAIALIAATILGLASVRLPSLWMVRPRGVGIPLPQTLLILLLLVAAALALTRYYATSLVAWGRGDLASGNLPGARQILDQSRRLNPLGFPASYWLAWTTLRSGDPQGAIEVSQRTIRIAPQNPGGHALTGEIALVGGRWQIAQAAFRRAVEQAPMAHLEYYAGLIEATARVGTPAETLGAYERAVSIFTPERVLHPEARCLSPGDRYLLARMSRIAAEFYAGVGDSAQRQTTLDRARSLAQPDLRGICANEGHPGQMSPEDAVMSFWQARSERGLPDDERFLLPEQRGPTADAARFAGAERDLPRRMRVTWILALSGDERSATLQYEVEGEQGEDRISRCVQTVLRFRREGWFLEDFPSLESGACRP